MNFTFKIWLGCSQILVYSECHFPAEWHKENSPNLWISSRNNHCSSANLCRSLRRTFALAVSRKNIFAFVSYADWNNNANFFDKFQRFVKATYRIFDGSFYSLRSLSPRELKHSSIACSETPDRVEGFHFGLWSLSISTASREGKKKLSVMHWPFTGVVLEEKLVRWMELAKNTA